MLPVIAAQIEGFRSFVSRWQHCYKFAIITFVALKRQDEAPLIITAAIHLVPMLDKSKLTLFQHESSSLIAGISYCELNSDSLKFLAAIGEGKAILRKDEKFSISDNDTNIIWAQFESGTNPIKTNQPRLATLLITGHELGPLIHKMGGTEEIDCELRASGIPFDGIVDLCNSLGLTRNQIPQKSELQITAASLVVLDRSNSKITKGTASINILMAPALKSEHLLIGIMPMNRLYAGRQSIKGNTISWEAGSDAAKGSININVDDNAAVQVFLSHAGTLFDRWWIFDAEKHINPAYAAHQAIDKDLVELKKLLCLSEDSKQGRNFEDGVALLLGLFRFSVIHYEGSLGEWPDLLAFTTANQLAVIECTTGIPGSDKLSKFIGRVEQIRSSLQGSGNAHIDILPVMLTSHARNGLENDIADAATRGVVMATRENIENLLGRVQMPPTPSDIFIEAKSLLSPITSLATSAIVG